jgi:hypothetical protein
MTVRFWKCRYKTMMIKTLSVTFPFANLPFEPFFYRLSRKSGSAHFVPPADILARQTFSFLFYFTGWYIISWKKQKMRYNYDYCIKRSYREKDARVF